MQLTTEVVGRRVTVRYRDGDGARDVVGRVLAVSTLVSIEQRDGTVVDVPVASIILWRVAPDRPLRSRRAAAVTADDLGRVTAIGWPAPETVEIGDWQLRAADGFTHRANSALVVGDPGVTFTDAVRDVVAFYAERGLPPLVQVVVDSAPEAAFREQGWIPLDGPRGGALVQVADLERPVPADPEVTVAPSLDDAWMSRYPRIEPGRVAAARAVLAGPARVGFASFGKLADGVAPIGIGRVVVTGEWAGLAALEVHPDHRRIGLARRLVSTMLSWATDRGADKAYVQVTPDNAAALNLYEKLGFTTHHAYRYLVPQPPDT